MKPAIARLRRVHAATWIAILALLSAGVSAQPGDPDTAPAPDPIRVEALAQRQHEAQREIAELSERADSLAPGDPERARIEEQLEVLRQVGSTLERAIEERRALDGASEPAPPADAPASTSIASLIEVYEEIEKDDARLEDLSRAVEAAREAEDAAEAALRDAERTRRAKVSVGVIYGSPTRLVEKLIRQALDENPKVLGHPEPIIVFSEFGDNSLDFDAYFWTRARGPMAVNQLGGEVRFRIDDLFREHELVIAFPQRDVHLDSASAIEVRMIGDGAGTKTSIEREDS